MLYEIPLYTSSLPFYTAIQQAAMNFFREKYRVNHGEIKRSEVVFVAGKRGYPGTFLPIQHGKYRTNRKQ